MLFVFGFSICQTNLVSALLNVNIPAGAAEVWCRAVLPAEPEDDVPHRVHDAAARPAALLLLLLGQSWKMIDHY